MVDESDQRFEIALREGAYAAAWRYCCRLTSSYEDAQDLLQDSVGQAYANYGALRESGKFKAWLLAIVRSRFLNQLRSRKLTVPLEEELVGQIEAGEGSDDEMLAHLRLLPPAQREALELFYIEGLTLAELGKVLGIPAVAARHRLHRAREALRRRVLGVEKQAVRSPRETQS